MDFKSGFGTMIWSTGGRYDGNFAFNKRHGQGKMIWGDGTTYEGQWKDGLRDGLGKLKSRFSESLGIFKENRFVKDQSFVFAGVPVGTYGEYKKNSKFGALNIANKGMRHALVGKQSTR